MKGFIEKVRVALEEPPREEGGFDFVAVIETEGAEERRDALVSVS